MKDDTRLTHAGLDPFAHQGAVNPPVYHASTILFPDLDTLEGRKPVKMAYGLRGTPTTFALEEAFTALERGFGTVLTPSGLGAVALALFSSTRSGDHVLVTDSVYGPTREFCDQVLCRYGVSTEYYDPLIGAGIARLLRPETTVVFLESPGSQTFEVQDVPAIAAAARAAGARVLMDNTWAAGYYFKPLEHGVDIAIHAGTKYPAGHADLMLGALVCTEAVYPQVRAFSRWLGNGVGPDDVYLALRGLRTLAVRLERHQRSALAIARWLQDRPEVLRVIHPALPEDPGHALWKRDFSGACGLFGFVLRPVSREALAAMLEGMTLFGMGWSWGGFESLLIPVQPEQLRSVTPWAPGGPTLRMHVGLEDADDLLADLEAGFQRLNQAT